MKIVYFGSDNFSRCILEAVLNTDHTVSAIVTTPDRKKGRGQCALRAPLKHIAQEKSIPCLQPEVLSSAETVAFLASLGADLFMIVSYGKILPEAVLDIPRLYALNIHPSLLPKYRGPSPINYTLLNGERESGFTVIKLNTRIDSGDIIFQKKVAIDDTINAYELMEMIASMAAQEIDTLLTMVEDGTAPLMTQDEGGVSYAPLLKKEDGHIDWNKPAQDIHNMIRAFVPWPSAYTFLKGKRLTVHRSVVDQDRKIDDGNKAGTIVAIHKDGWVRVTTRDGYLNLHEVQMEGKKRMNAFEWTKGQRISVGDTLG
ncbi:MAG: methionyl-tRNA formyltransferase [Candidatus Omnitrophica bacterium]|nr:methionyl-tRNA formyltransferase [Candidatus Omnitrophota bacterium]